MVSESNSYQRRSGSEPLSGTDAVNSKMQKSHITPPQRRKLTLKDDNNTKYVGQQMEKKGTKGAAVSLSSNCYKFSYDPNVQVHQYSAVFDPEIKFSKLRKSLIQECKFEDHYDYNYTCCFFRSREQDEFVKTVQRRDGTDVKITFKYINTLLPNSPELYSMIGYCVKNCIANMGLVQINKGLFLMDSKRPIGNFGMDVVTGYNTTVMAHQDELLLTINHVNKVMNSQNCDRAMINLLNKHKGNKGMLDSEVLGTTVLCLYNNQCYKVTEICWDLSPRSTFTINNRDGTTKEVTYVEYFKDHYNCDIRNLSQPLFKTFSKRGARGEDRSICLVPELCTFCGIPEDLFQNFQFKKSMEQTCAKDPRTLSNLTRSFMNSFRKSKAYQHLRNWGVDVQEQPRNIPARKLNGYTCQFGQGKTCDSSRIDFRDKAMIDTGHNLETIYVLNENQRDFQSFENSFFKVAGPLGLRPRKVESIDMRDRNRFFESHDRELRGSKNIIIVAILRFADKVKYDFVKKMCSLELGIPCQVMLNKHFQKNTMSVMTKIACQIGCKMGGAPYAITIPPKETFMVIGMDTYHDTQKKGQSCVAICASLNNSFTKYSWACAMVASKGEMNSLVYQQMKALVKEFTQFNGAPPTKVIIFRDGIGEGMVQSCMEQEYVPMKAAVQEANPQAKLSFFTLSKRIENRFYGNGGRSPQGGTVVDSVVTQSNFMDFYLVSVDSRQGCVAPVHFRNHVNEGLNLRADNYQLLAYLLCHTYFNWNGAIKVPSVCQYAHKLAYLVGSHLHAQPSRNLCNQLFFL